MFYGGFFIDDQNQFLYYRRYSDFGQRRINLHHFQRLIYLVLSRLVYCNFLRWNLK